MTDLWIFHLQEVEFLQIMVLRWPLKDVHLLTEIIQPVTLATLTCIGMHLVLHQGGVIWMMVMIEDLRGLLLHLPI
jgi:hypothetical protein